MTSIMTIYAAFLLGLASSLHCFAMCGAFVMAFSGNRKNKHLLFPSSAQNVQVLDFTHEGTVRVNNSIFTNLISYGAHIYHFAQHPQISLNFGRIITYGLLAILVTAIFNLYGEVINVNKNIWTDALRILTGLAIIGNGIQLTFKISIFDRAEKVGACLFSRLKGPISWLLPKQKSWSYVLLGMLWGLLPCGIIYGVLLMSASSGSYTYTLYIIIAFGLGTLPALLSLGACSTSAHLFLKKRNFQRIIGFLIIFSGIWWLSTPLLMNLGFELSPFTQSFLPACH